MTARLRGWQIFCLSLFLLFASLGHANLPDSFNGWQTKSFRPISANLLEQFAGDNAVLLHEYGFVSGQRREYERDSSTLSVTLWQMRDATGSFGLFTFFQQPGMEEREGEDSMVGGQGRWLARRGAFVIDARGENLSSDEAPMLLNEVPNPRRQEILPLLPAYLPEENLVPSSTKFLMGPVGFERQSTPLSPFLIGFDLGAEAAVAQYRTEDSRFRLLLVSYATPQLAARQLRTLEASAQQTGGETPRSDYMRRKGSLLAFVMDEPEEALAESLFDGIRYESVVTWNERAPNPRDNVGNLLLAAFLLTGFCLLITLVAGISFGGLRYLAKKFLPWAVFDRPAAMEIIRLNISDK